MKTIEAIVFDVGGVLHENNSAFDDGLIQALNITPETLKTIRANEITALGKGEIDETEFWRQVQVNYGIRPVSNEENLLGRSFDEALKPHTAMLEFVKELGKGDIKLAILSNTIAPHAKVLKRAGIYNGFDHVLLSHEMGMHKPDPAIYEYALEVLRTDPKGTIFVDDSPKNVAAAQRVGMRGIVYTDAQDVIAKIRSAINL